MLCRSEIKSLLQATKNPKYKLMLALGYASGLRVSEVTNLKVSDLDLTELVVHLKNAKGKKDRISVLPRRLQNDLRNMIAGKKAQDFVLLAK